MSTEEVAPLGNLDVGDELCTGSRHEALSWHPLFPSIVSHQMLVHLQEQRGIALDFSTWALGHIDERVRSMALEYAHDAEVLVQILSFTGGTFASLIQAIEDLYQHEQITQRVYVAFIHNRKVAHIGLKVSSPGELLAYYQEVKARGLNIFALYNHGMALALYVPDPEGNLIEIYWPTGREDYHPPLRIA